MHSTASFNELKLESSQIVSLHITTASTKDSTTASTIAATKTFTPTSTSPCTSLASTSTSESAIPLTILRCFCRLRHLGGTNQRSHAQQGQYTLGGLLEELST